MPDVRCPVCERSVSALNVKAGRMSEADPPAPATAWVEPCQHRLTEGQAAKAMQAFRDHSGEAGSALPE